MGCTEAGKLESDEGRVDTDARSKRFQTLVSLMLSSQTKDPVTAEATASLRRTLPGGLTLESILASSVEDIQQCICKVGALLFMLPTQSLIVTQVFGEEKANTLKLPQRC